MIGCKIRGKDIFAFLETDDVPRLRQKEKISGDLINLEPTVSLRELELIVDSEVCARAKKNLVVEEEIKLGVLNKIKIIIPSPAYYELATQGTYEGDSEQEPVHLMTNEKMGPVHRRVYESLSSQRIRLS